jgi:hypothetical protein
MKRMVSVLVLLAVVGAGRAGEKDIVERLKTAGASVGGTGREGDPVTVVGLEAESIADLSELCELPHLSVLRMFRQDVTDADLRIVGSLTGLRRLLLNACPVTDAHLKEVARLHKLDALSLSHTRITDAGLEEVAGLGCLELLWLSGTSVTDEGLRHIERLSKLKLVDLSNCPGVTDAGVARLQKALPKCRIRR